MEHIYEINGIKHKDNLCLVCETYEFNEYRECLYGPHKHNWKQLSDHNKTCTKCNVRLLHKHFTTYYSIPLGFSGRKGYRETFTYRQEITCGELSIIRGCRYSDEDDLIKEIL